MAGESSQEQGAWSKGMPIPADEQGSKEKPYETPFGVPTQLTLKNTQYLSTKYEGARVFFTFHQITFSMGSDYGVELEEGKKVEGWSDEQNKKSDSATLDTLRRLAADVRDGVELDVNGQRKPAINSEQMRSQSRISRLRQTLKNIVSNNETKN